MKIIGEIIMASGLAYGLMVVVDKTGYYLIELINAIN
jgi:hypothetical protein